MEDKRHEGASKFSVFADKPGNLELTAVVVNLITSVKSHDVRSIYSASCCIWTMTNIIDALLKRGYGGAPLTIDELIQNLPQGPNPPSDVDQVGIDEDNDEYENEDEDEDEGEGEDEDSQENEEETIGWLTARFRQRRRWPRIALEAAAAAYGMRNPLRLIAAAVNLPIIRTNAIVGKSGAYEVWVAQPGWPEETS